MCSCLLKFQEPDPSEQPQSMEKDCFQSTVQRGNYHVLSCTCLDGWRNSFPVWQSEDLIHHNSFESLTGGCSDHRGPKGRLAGA